MTVLVTVDKDTNMIEPMWLTGVTTAKFPLWLNYDTLAIIEVDREMVYLLHPFNGDLDKPMQFVKKSGYKKVLYDLDNNTVLYDFTTHTFLSYNGFTVAPKPCVHDNIYVRDNDNKLWRAYNKTGFALLSYSLYYSARLNDYRPTDYGKNLFLGLMARVYGITDYNSTAYHFNPRGGDVEIIPNNSTNALSKIAARLNEKNKGTASKEDDKLIMTIDEFIALEAPPAYPVYLKDTKKVFPPGISSIIYSNNKIIMYFSTPLPPALSQQQISGALNLSGDISISFSKEYEYETDEAAVERLYSEYGSGD
jgi:hypothetical protein